MGYAAAEVEVAPVAQLFRALGDEVRLRIVALLSHGELCVCHIETALELLQSNASRHLGILRAAGVVEYERRDKWVYYRLAPQVSPERRRLLKTLVEGFARKDVLRKDVAKLVKAKGPSACK